MSLHARCGCCGCADIERIGDSGRSSSAAAAHSQRSQRRSGNERCCNYHIHSLATRSATANSGRAARVAVPPTQCNEASSTGGGEVASHSTAASPIRQRLQHTPFTKPAGHLQGNRRRLHDDTCRARALTYVTFYVCCSAQQATAEAHATDVHHTDKVQRTEGPPYRRPQTHTHIPGSAALSQQAATMHVR